MPLADIIPLLLEKQRGRTAARQKRQRVNEMTRNFILLQSGEDIANLGGPPSQELRTRATRAQAFFGLAGQGVNFPQSFLEPAKQTNWPKIYTDFKVPSEIANLHKTGVLDDESFSRFLMKNFDTTDLSDDQILAFRDAIPELQGRSLDELKAIRDFDKAFSATTKANLLAGDDPALKAQLEAEQMARITDGIDAGDFRSMSDLPAADRAFVLDKFKSKPSRDALFDDKYNAERLITLGMKSINTRITSELLGPRVAPFIIAEWVQGDTEDMTQPQIDLLNKFLNKDGSTNNDAIVAEGVRIVELQEQLRDELRTNPVAVALTPLAEAFINDSVAKGYSKEFLRAWWKKRKAANADPIGLSDEDFENIMSVYPEISDGK